MNRFSLVVLAACFLVCSCKWSYYQEPEDCKENEEHGECVSHCEETCNLPRNRPCTRNCHYKCYCKDGYVRRVEFGECIRREDCPSKTSGEDCPSES